MRTILALRPDVPSFGYATLLSINATSIWGGIFPYLPEPCQTPTTTIVFYTVQIALFLATFCAVLLFTWRRPQLAQSAHVLVFSLPLGFGPLMLVGAMYLSDIAMALVIAAAVLIGIGSAGFLMSWQRVFAAMDAARGTLALIKGTAYSALIYFCVGFIPEALTAYLIPLVMVPLAGLCLWLAARMTSSDQPMFQDVPAEHAQVYRNALRESLPVALSIGALGFSSGAIRFIAVTHQQLFSMINIVSMFALFAVVVVLYLVWRRHTLHVDPMSVFRVLLPVAGTCLIVLPFAGAGFTNTGFAVTYACFMLACMLMMMHCGQISRDSGINPLFVYAFYGVIAYFMQMCGYLVGYVSGSEGVLGVEQLSLVAVVSLYVMLLVALFGRRVSKLHTTRLEFLMLTPRAPGSDTSAELAVAKTVQAGANAPANEGASGARAGASRAEDAGARRQASGGRAPREGDGGGRERLAREVAPAYGGEPRADSIARRCAKLSELYGLSSREAEVMELIVRGHTGPAIAEMLFISENTMRTHNKRIYAKMGIHKKQELLMLVESMNDE